jgi:hypothetical protein
LAATPTMPAPSNLDDDHHHKNAAWMKAVVANMELPEFERALQLLMANVLQLVSGSQLPPNRLPELVA